VWFGAQNLFNILPATLLDALNPQKGMEQGRRRAGAGLFLFLFFNFFLQK
jgi:hypothetical protein